MDSRAAYPPTAARGLQRIDTPEQFERYLSRLKKIPAFLAACEDVMREGIETGFVAPRLVVGVSYASPRSGGNGTSAGDGREDTVLGPGRDVATQDRS